MTSPESASGSKNLRTVELDDVDRKIVDALNKEGRITIADLAAAVGIAPSTAHARMRALVDRGVIQGFHAAVDHGRIGRGLQAIIGVSLRGGTRHDSIVASTRTSIIFEYHRNSVAASFT
ncbi:Lrp/AsnC family transcriptional regulator [Microbacterium amylolyticum]|uniref:DNA-binding Lrp family transcriptional regulator n=1 Tax=Microbacterium amylolyticum TaxID=936337 RepID=A0ABS4ZI52_9MICO|nr:winged helix-turn-helix transcriptional regulator [Microbacterium amylolyticum]MBP2436959.1 DNA-binding Lrp family transcriptional regulator [Microbacterium amylolyticum]